MKKLLLVLLLGNLTREAMAQTIFFSLQQVLDHADKNNLVLKQAKINQQISVKDESLARTALVPRINLFRTADFYPIIPSQVVPDRIFGGSGDKFTKVQFGLPLNFSTGLEFSMPVINFEKWETLKKMAWQTEQARWSTETEKERLH